MNKREKFCAELTLFKILAIYQWVFTAYKGMQFTFQPQLDIVNLDCKNLLGKINDLDDFNILTECNISPLTLRVCGKLKTKQKNRSHEN